MSKNQFSSSKINEAMSWSYSGHNNTPGLYSLSSSYMDACRLDSPNGSEYRGISARIRRCWSLLNETLLEGAARPESREAEWVLSTPRSRKTL